MRKISPPPGPHRSKKDIGPEWLEEERKRWYMAWHWRNHTPIWDGKQVVELKKHPDPGVYVRRNGTVKTLLNK